jgi:hypothetical protein
MLCSFAFLSGWIAISHIAKRHVIKALSSINDDNIQISYKDVQISGFPSKFIVSIKHPLIQIVNSHQVKTLSFRTVDLYLDLWMQKPYFEIGSEYIIRTHTADMILQSESKIRPSSPMMIALELDESLLKSAYNGSYNFKSLHSYVDFFEILRAEQVVAKLEHVLLDIVKISDINNDFKCNAKIQALYNTGSDSLTNMNLDLDLVRHYSSSKEDRSYLKEVALKNLTIKTAMSRIGISGNVTLPRQQHAVGKLDINLENYPELVSIVTRGGIRSEAFFNKVLTRATKSELNDEIDLAKYAKFTVKFTEDRIYFGSIEMNQLIMDALKNE